MNHETTFANQSLPPGMFLLKTMFREPSSVRLLAFCTFLLIYIIAFVGNFMLIVLIVWEKQLHKPVYIFLANLNIYVGRKYILFPNGPCPCNVSTRMLQ
uniref:G-protein coupled receptors family 1 profile domain-containing protein n=1 Tax=Eptatretus burgeri TaxID=7764 RepID=A0A8C4R1A0_EPTBU